MAGEWTSARVSEVADVIDYVANGSFESLRNNVTYRTEPDYAVLVRLVDHNAGWSGGFVYVDKASYDFLRKSALEPGDIVIANVGANAGSVFRVPDLGTRMTLGPNAVLCRPKQAAILQRDFLYYYLISEAGQNSLQSILSGSAQPKFNKTDFRSLSVPIPPFPEQRAIAHILGTLDDKIELNGGMNQTLEAMAQALFKSWFVDFDPVRAKGEGRDPGLPKPLADLFPNRLVESELGEIPEEWDVSSVGQVADVIDCLHSKKPERLAAGMPLLQLANIRDDGLIDMEDTYFIDEADYRKWVSRMEASPGDCVITNVGRVGAVAQMPVGQKAALGRNMTGVRCKPAFPFPSVLIECLLSQAMKDEIVLKMDTGTILDALNVRNIPRLRFVRPRTREILEYFEHKVRPLRARMESHLAESRNLVALRDALLPKLISGELRVNKIEIATVAAA